MEESLHHRKTIYALILYETTRTSDATPMATISDLPSKGQGLESCSLHYCCDLTPNTGIEALMQLVVFMLIHPI